MDSDALTALTATEAAAAIGRGDTSSAELVETLLARIEALDGRVQAWEQVDPEAAVAAAHDADRAVAGGDRRPLAGVPFGVKDIIDVAGMATACGYPGLAGAIARRDSIVVSRLRAAGAVVLGKMVTTQFAWMDPSRTRNPWALDHSPGGSSSGPAAGVAARMVPMALGTQTGGSVLRPASFTGIIGFKPTRGRISLRGVHPLSPSFDHVGVLARSVDDCRQFLAAASQRRGRASIASRERPVVGILDDTLEIAAPDVRAAVESVADRAASDRVPVQRIRLPVGLEDLRATHWTMMTAEAATVHAERFARERELYAPGIARNLDVGRSVAAHEYLRARSDARRITRGVGALLARRDVLLLPTSARTSPPLADAITGDPLLQLIGSLTGFPAVSLPCGRDSDGLPIGVQLIGRPGEDGVLLDLAAWVAQLLPVLPAPDLVKQVA